MKLIPFNLFERVRDPEQAVKLADYMSKRSKPLTGYAASRGPNIDFKGHVETIPQYLKDGFEKKWHAGDVKRMDINPHDTVMTQHSGVNLGGVNMYAREEHPVDKPVYIIRHGDRNLVYNGHHRVMAARLRGHKSIPAIVAEFPKSPPLKIKKGY